MLHLYLELFRYWPAERKTVLPWSLDVFIDDVFDSLSSKFDRQASLYVIKNFEQLLVFKIRRLLVKNNR